MRKLSIAAAVVLAFGVLSASADDKITTRLTGWEENPSLSTPATGTFVATINKDETEIDYTLTYTALMGNVTQAHIHVSQRGVNGGISAWLCGTATNPGPAGTPACPPLALPGDVATVSGTITSAQVIGPAAQFIAPGELAELIAAIRAGAAYANVHSSVAPPGEIRGQIDTRGGSDLHRH